MTRGNGEISTVFLDFKRTWGQMLLFTIATRISVSVLLMPLLALALRIFLIGEERPVLSDTEIAAFFLSPVGLVALVIVGGFWIGVALVEQAGLMTIGFAAGRGRRFHWFASWQFVGAKLKGILPLGSHLLARALLVIAQFLVPAGLVFWIFLRHHDINYYLQNRPAEFYWAAAIIVPLIIAMLVSLASKAASWALSLPILLFENLRPARAIQTSAQATAGHRWPLVGWLVAWILLGTIASLATTWLIGVCGRLALPVSTDSAGGVAFVIGAVGVTTLIANTLISILAAALFALVIVRLYGTYCAAEEIPAALADAEKFGERRGARIQAKGILCGCAGLIVLAAIASWVILSRVESDDDVLIIAHRGSAATAPENTMAAVREAIESGADFVEIDVQETADGQVVVFHDSDFMKTAGDPLKIWHAERSDLDRLDVGSWFDAKFASERTPTLDEVLKACKAKVKVNIELKYYGHDTRLEELVIEIVERNAMQSQVVLMSLKSDKVAKIKAMRPGWKYGLLSSVQLGDISNFDVDFLAVSAGGASRRFVRRAKGAGFDLYVWTVNDPFQMSSMMSRGVDGIITDKPAVAKKVLELRSELNPVERLLIGIGTEVGVFSLKGKFHLDEGA